MLFKTYLFFLGVAVLLGLSYILREASSTDQVLSGARQVSIIGRTGLQGRVQPYAQSDILRTLPNFSNEPLRVLVFDGIEFTVYKLFPKDDMDRGGNGDECHREGPTVPVMVDALRRNHPKRFAPGSPPFQLLFTTNDCVATLCVNHPAACSTERFVPLLAFGTVPKNQELLPTVQVFPIHAFVECIYAWRTRSPNSASSSLRCKYPSEPISPTTPWKRLKPQIIWRGNDFRFSFTNAEFFHLKSGPEIMQTNSKNLTKLQVIELLFGEWDNLLPRWRGVLLSLEAEADAAKRNDTLPCWIDCRFFIGNNKASERRITRAGLDYVLSPTHMDSEEMSQYRYQIDFGGAGGTTWFGTVTKLAMPGLLFHHETRMKDWFYDDMKPWVHYVPVKWDLSDLRQKFVWAETHPKQAELIAQEGTKFALHLLSEKYLNE